MILVATLEETLKAHDHAPCNVNAEMANVHTAHRSPEFIRTFQMYELPPGVEHPQSNLDRIDKPCPLACRCQCQANKLAIKALLSYVANLKRVNKEFGHAVQPAMKTFYKALCTKFEPESVLHQDKSKDCQRFYNRLLRHQYSGYDDFLTDRSHWWKIAKELCESFHKLRDDTNLAFELYDLLQKSWPDGALEEMHVRRFFEPGPNDVAKTVAQTFKIEDDEGNRMFQIDLLGNFDYYAEGMFIRDVNTIRKSPHWQALRRGGNIS